MRKRTIMKNNRLSRLTKFLLTKKVKYIAGIIFCLCVGYLLAIFTHPMISPAAKVKSTPMPSRYDEEKPSYIVDIPAKYFDPDEIHDGYPGTTILLGGNLEITNPPVAINRPTDIDVIDEEFTLGEPSTYLDNSSFDPVDMDNDGKEKEYYLRYGKSMDVNDDGEKEKVLYGSVAMTHRPHKAIIIDENGRIIYKSEEHGSISLFESKSHNGFYLIETFDIGAFPMSGGRRITRFIHEDGKFIPVWYREIFDLQTTEP